MITPFSKEWGYGASVVKWLIVVNVGIWIVMVLTGIFSWLNTETFWYRLYASSPDMVFHKNYYWQLVTSMFMHDGGNILHVALNMYFLWMFGTRLERDFGSKTFLYFYLVCGIVGSLLSLGARALLGDWYVPSVGASSAVFGIIVAYGFLYANETLILLFIWRVKAWKVIAGLVALETLFLIFQLFNVNVEGAVGVDHWAHLGGAIASAVWMLLLRKKQPFRIADGPMHPSTFVISSGKPVSNATVRSEGKLFRVIVHPKQPEQPEHPEGTDDEPPPDWFKL